MNNKIYWVYILSSKKNGTLYVGITNNIIRRAYEHKKKLQKGFTKKYNVSILVYTEQYTDVKAALYREKCIKEWKRAWKIKLIEDNNPDWKDLYQEYTKN